MPAELFIGVSLLRVRSGRKTRKVANTEQRARIVGDRSATVSVSVVELKRCVDTINNSS